MPEDSPFQDSQKLVRCQVVNRYRETSVRFIEVVAFRLWEYMMTTKHGLKIGEPQLCLWVHEREYRRNASVFDRAGNVEPVNRIVVDLFDREYRFSQTVIRYARTVETDQVLDILRSHIPPDLRASDNCHIAVIGGQVVQQWHPNASRNILMGLEG